MSKYAFLALFLLGVLTHCNSPETQHNTERAEILQLIQNQTTAWNAGSIEGFMGGYWRSDSLRFCGKNGITYGWNNTLSNYQRGFPNREDMGRLTLEVDSLQRSAWNTVIVDGRWTIYRKDTIGGRFTLFFDRPNGKDWKIVEDHTW